MNLHGVDVSYTVSNVPGMPDFKMNDKILVDPMTVTVHNFRNSAERKLSEFKVEFGSFMIFVGPDRTLLDEEILDKIISPFVAASQNPSQLPKPERVELSLVISTKPKDAPPSVQTLSAAALGADAATGRPNEVTPPILTVEEIQARHEMPRGAFRFYGVIREVTMKTSTIAEIDLEETSKGTFISAVSYQEEISKRLIRLPKNRYVEISQSRTQLKTINDINYQRNPCRYKILIDVLSKLEVSAAEVPSRIFVRQYSAYQQPHQPNPAIKDISGNSKPAPPNAQCYQTIPSHEPRIAPPGYHANRQNNSTPHNSSGNSGGSGPTRTRTLFKPPSQQPPQPEKSVRQIEKEEMRRRQNRLNIEAAQQELDDDEKKRTTRALNTCCICGLDLTPGSNGMKILRHKIEALRQGKLPQLIGKSFTDVALQILFEDPRQPGSGRLYAERTFIHPHTRKHHKVHPRCAHLVTRYQRDEKLEDVLFDAKFTNCELCGAVGATAACYHPDCKKIYHTTCLILMAACGETNFGVLDPHKPCTSCPTHMYIKPDRTLTGGDAKGDEDDGDDSALLFDVRKVEKGDLRDPDNTDEDSDLEFDL